MTQHTAIDETGNRYSRLLVLERAPAKYRRNGKSYAVWLCRCDCGARLEVPGSNLRRGNTRSCGCLRKDSATRHSMKNHPLYRTWQNMMARCYNPKLRAYKWYGAVGVSVCPDWHSVQNFTAQIQATLGRRPEGMTLDRINPFGSYEPGNVRWATPKTQANNRRIHH